MWLLVLLFCFSVAGAQTVDTLQDEIVAAYKPCLNSVHCTAIFEIDQPISDDKKQYFYTSEFNNSLLNYGEDDIIDPFNYLPPLPTDSDYVSWAIIVRSSEPPYCLVEGESLVWIGSSLLPTCECIQGVCLDGECVGVFFLCAFKKKCLTHFGLFFFM